MLSELHKLCKLIWQKKKMLWLQIMKIFFYSVVFTTKYFTFQASNRIDGLCLVTFFLLEYPMEGNLCVKKNSNQIHVKKKKKHFQDLLSQHFFFCQINLNHLFSSDNLFFGGFLMIKSISFVVLAHLFHFNQLKIKATRLLNFLS